MYRSWVSSLLLLLLFVSDVSSRGLVDEQPPKDTSNSNSTTTQNVIKANGTSSEPSLPSTNSTSSDPKESASTSPPPPPSPPPPSPSPPQLQAEGEKNVTVVANATETLISPPPANQTESLDDGKLPAKVEPPPKSLESGGNATVGDAGNPPPPAKDIDKVDEAKGSSESAIAETCAGKSKICRTENSLVACTLSIEKDSSNWSILVQNEGEESLKAKIVLPVNSLPELTLTKHQSQRVNISISGDTNKIILDAGKGECVLHMYSPKESTLSMIHLPSYEKLVTPINGAYFLIVSVVIFGGAWGLCLCRKNRRADNGVPYRELEMSGGSGLESESMAHDLETADWDEGWDDDWDENNAVKSPGGVANSARISANGLTARGPSRDGWDHDWDD